MVDLPRLSQWRNCLTDILAADYGYDNRESIKITMEKGPGDADFAYLAGKGLSRVSALLFAIIKGADIIENHSDPASMDKSKLDMDMLHWYEFLGLFGNFP